MHLLNQNIFLLIDLQKTCIAIATEVFCREAKWEKMQI